MSIEEITEDARSVLHLLDEYHNPPHREMLIDPVYYAYLRGKYDSVSRQHHVPVYGDTKPKRIDFRIGGNNPVVIELAVRPPKGGGQLLGKPNTSELRKLCRVSTTKAQLRVLLLIDLYHLFYTREILEQHYKPIHAGPGRFERNPVRVIYLHRANSFNFGWSPFKSC